MRKFDWDAVSDAPTRPVPGGYVAIIRDVIDDEQKEYLKVCFDFAEGQFKGTCKRSNDTYGNWPLYGTFIRSYKQSALPYFKGFKTSLEMTNKGYKFDESNLQAMVGKGIGVVLGEELYTKNDGTDGKRLYVAEVRTADAIRKGDFKVPELRTAKNYTPKVDDASPDKFQDVTDDEDGLPF